MITDWLRRKKAAKQRRARELADEPRRQAVVDMLHGLLSPAGSRRNQIVAVETVREEARWLARVYAPDFHEAWVGLILQCEKVATRESATALEKLSLPIANSFFIRQLESSGSLDELREKASSYESKDARNTKRLDRLESMDLMNASNLVYKYDYESRELHTYIRNLYYYSELEELILNSELPYLLLPTALEEKIQGMLDRWPWDPDCEESRPLTYEEREFGDFTYKGGQDQWLAARDKCRAKWTACRPVERV